MTLQQLRYAIGIAETGSFNKATEKLYVSQPSLTAAIRELEKIEMVRGLDGRYRMDHAVTATQKDILRAFHLDAAAVKKQADELSEMLNKYDRQTLEEQ